MPVLNMDTSRFRSVSDETDANQVREKLDSEKLSLKQNNLNRWGVSILFSALLFVLLMEWIHPLYAYLGSEGMRLTLLLYTLTAGLLFVGCLRLPSVLYVIITSLMSVFALYYIQGNGEGVPWLSTYIGTLQEDVVGVWSLRSLYGVSAETRTFILLIGWTLLVASVQMIILHRQSMLLFFCATLLYLLTLEFLFETNVYYGIVRAIAGGLVLQVLLHYARMRNGDGETDSYPQGDTYQTLIQGQHIHDNRSPSMRVSVMTSTSALVLGIGVSVILIYVLSANAITSLLPTQPLKPLAWRDALISMEAWRHQSTIGHTASQVHISGYGENDEELGAPLQLREKTLFIAETPERTRWRGESKMVYTGRGWSQPDRESPLELDWDSATQPVFEPVTQPGTLGADSMPESPLQLSESPAEDEAVSAYKRDQRMIQQTLRFASDISTDMPILSGGTPLQVKRVFTKGDAVDHVPVKYIAASDAVFFNMDKDRAPHRQATQVSKDLSFIRGYELTVDVRSTQLGERMQGEQAEGQPQVDVAGEGTIKVDPADPAEISENYLQLPDSLPRRVRNLGQKLTSGQRNRSDAVQAVRTYLGQHYSYTLDTELPPQGADFVDNFLFERNDGYCNHFSSSMVVLLRSGGIPARWVKGYAPGRQSESNPSEYIVEYADAHSWVEVYFPNEGWVPFEATPGFTSAGLETAEDHRVDLGSDGGMRGYIRNVIEVWTQHTQDWAMEVIKVVQGKLWMIAALICAIIAAAFVGMALMTHRRILYLWILIHRTRVLFPNRGHMLLAGEAVWLSMYGTYGVKLGGLTAREYVDRIQGIEDNERQRYKEFISTWESICYGGIQFDRRGTIQFLQQCLRMMISLK